MARPFTDAGFDSVQNSIHTGGWGFGLGAALCLLVFFAAIAPAIAVGTGAPADCYRPPSATETEAVKNTGFYQGYAGKDAARLRIFTHFSDKTAYYFVRMESDFCNKSRCMTGIFKGDISSGGLQSWGALPPLTKIGKAKRIMCDGCDPIFPLEFYSAADNPSPGKTIYIWRHGVFFGGT